MKNICLRCLVPAAMLLVLSVRCDRLLGPGAEIQGLLYANSFESAADTAGWRGYAGIQIVRDAPPGGGILAARIAGGCIIPHAFVEIPGPQKDSYLVLACWGKKLSGGGGVSLALTRNPGGQIRISITDTLWSRYESTDSLFCPAGDSLRIEMNCGGIIPGAMLVDLLEIREGE